MADSHSSKLSTWESWAALRTEAAAFAGWRARLALHRPDDLATELYAAEVLHPGRRRAEGVEPFSLQWFLDVENARLGRYGRWIPRLLEFAKHGGETLLGVGYGLGTDWVQYARHGASLVACCPSAAQLDLVQRNFELRGLRGTFLHASPTALPLEPASVDVALIGDLFDGSTDPRPVLDEVYRVLRPGGKVLALFPARYDVDFWSRRLLWRRPRQERPAGFGSRQLHRLFARFSEHRVSKRHLRRGEVPHLWRWLPLPVLERLFGRFLVFKAFKPLSAAIHVPLAA